ncbi:hypothetical protein MK280_04210 [Myxococcota bacterium]|nr:hypothetical protein [Myxococcota bacterium]
MAETKTPKEFAYEYLAALRGEVDRDYLDMWDNDITYTVPGLWPLAGEFHSKDEYMQGVMESFDENYANAPEPEHARPGAGLYGYEFISEGNTVVVLARSRARDSRGMPYTNTFFMWFDLNEEGKAIRYMDMADFSSGWQAFFGVHLE